MIAWAQLLTMRENDPKELPDQEGLVTREREARRVSLTSVLMPVQSIV